MTREEELAKLAKVPENRRDAYYYMRVRELKTPTPARKKVDKSKLRPTDSKVAAREQYDKFYYANPVQMEQFDATGSTNDSVAGSEARKQFAEKTKKYIAANTQPPGESDYEKQERQRNEAKEAYKHSGERNYYTGGGSGKSKKTDMSTGKRIGTKLVQLKYR